MNRDLIQTTEGVLVRCVGGPLDGRLLRVPALDDSFTVHPEDNFGKTRNLASGLRQVHQYVISNRVTLGGIPTYRYAGAKQ